LDEEDEIISVIITNTLNRVKTGSGKYLLAGNLIK